MKKMLRRSKASRLSIIFMMFGINYYLIVATASSRSVIGLTRNHEEGRETQRENNVVLKRKYIKRRKLSKTSSSSSSLSSVASIHSVHPRKNKQGKKS
mmetsp:Transcript_6558/g.8309  ORF Transcript_6558/g.8309 Transcript_6558/m.8309 type:complete len:98 (-) Transcript_6558:341-634(-)